MDNYCKKPPMLFLHESLLTTVTFDFAHFSQIIPPNPLHIEMLLVLLFVLKFPPLDWGSSESEKSFLWFKSLKATQHKDDNHRFLTPMFGELQLEFCQTLIIMGALLVWSRRHLILTLTLIKVNKDSKWLFCENRKFGDIQWPLLLCQCDLPHPVILK